MQGRPITQLNGTLGTLAEVRDRPRRETASLGCRRGGESTLSIRAPPGSFGGSLRWKREVLLSGATAAISGVFYGNAKPPPRRPRKSLPRLYVLAEGHASRNLTPALWVSADAYYNVGGETSVDGVAQSNAADTLRLGAGMGVSLWAGGDLIFDYERVVAKPIGEPDAQTVRMTIRQLW